MGFLDAPAIPARLPVPGCLNKLTVAQVNDNLSNGTTETAGNFRVRMLVVQGCFNPSFAFANWYCSLGRDTDGPNDITVRVALESPNGDFVPLYFNGARDVVIGPGGTVWTDPTGVDLRFGDLWFMRTYVTVAAGGKWGRNVKIQAALGEGAETGAVASVTDKTTTGTITASGGSAVTAVAVRATPAKTRIPVIGVVADSVGSGTGDETNAVDWGWIRRALNNQYALQMVGMPSDQCNNWTDNPAQLIPTRTSRRRPLLAGCTHIVAALGRNTISATTAVDDASGIAVLTIALWNWLRRRGCLVWQTTCTPDTTSTDAWATTVNQTVGSAGKEANRLIWNAWIRDGCPLLADAYIAAGTTNPAAVRAGQSGHPLSGVLDPTLLAESALNSGIWKAAYTDDGIHPNTVGHTALAAALTPTIFGPAASA